MIQHKGINQFYDIPSISLRGPFLAQVLADTKLVDKMFNGEASQVGGIEGLDLRHVSWLCGGVSVLFDLCLDHVYRLPLWHFLAA